MEPVTYPVDRLELLKSAVHELRTPASGIFDLADTILATTRRSLDEQTLADVSTIQGSAQRVLSLLDALVDLMTVEIVEPRRVELDLAPVIQEAMRPLTAASDWDRRVTKVWVPPTMPPVCINPDGIAQATAMLLAHATHFLLEDEDICVSVSLNGDFFVVTIGAGQTADQSAPGIIVPFPPERLRGIWSVELLTVSRIITLHRGQFWASLDNNDRFQYHYSLPIVSTKPEETR